MHHWSPSFWNVCYLVSLIHNLSTKRITFLNRNELNYSEAIEMEVFLQTYTTFWKVFLILSPKTKKTFHSLFLSQACWNTINNWNLKSIAPKITLHVSKGSFTKHKPWESLTLLRQAALVSHSPLEYICCNSTKKFEAQQRLSQLRTLRR